MYQACCMRMRNRTHAAGGNKTALLAPFTPEEQKSKRNEFEVKTIYCPATKKSLKGRKKFVRGFNTMNQMEICYIASKEEIDMAEKTRNKFEGTNYGNVVGPITLDSYEQMWTLSWKEKKALYGAHRHPPGGPNPGPSSSSAEKRVDTTREVAS